MENLSYANRINDIIIPISKNVVLALQAEQNNLGIKHYTSPSGKNVRLKFSKKNDIVNRIQFKFKKSMVYVEKGAGRGYAGYKGSSWYSKKGEKHATNPQSLNKMGTSKRIAKPWFNPVIEKFTDELVSKTAQEFVDISFKKLKIK